jgi:hypothetical protein
MQLFKYVCAALFAATSVSAASLNLGQRTDSCVPDGDVCEFAWVCCPDLYCDFLDVRATLTTSRAASLLTVLCVN